MCGPIGLVNRIARRLLYLSLPDEVSGPRHLTIDRAIYWTQYTSRFWSCSTHRCNM